MLRIKKLIVHYGPFMALNKISLEVNVGEVVTLVGPNKAGKTTLLLTLSGIVETTEGRVLFQDADITNLDPYKIVARGLGHVPQGRHIFPTISVFDNLMVGAYIRRKAKGEIEEDLTRIYELFPVLKKRGKQRAGTLSGGEQQMLAIGRALMGRPNLLMLDEPSSGLAPRYIDEIFAAFQELNRRGLTIFIVEQEIQRSLAISHRGYVLRNGRLIKKGPAPALVESREVQELCLG
ncbi:MAG: ABC transporter ATP-binding protein [Deltaproteobacteria bacterium]|nr:ABC transporter ATP-binding protein [Deltaproteobacteria bacterium]